MSQKSTIAPERAAPAGSVDADEVDVVILTWNDGELLAKAVQSARQNQGVTTNIIVVDNGSQPPANVPEGVVLIRNEHNIGVAAGRNQGIAAGTAPLILILDSDAELRAGSLESLVAEQRRTNAGVVVPVFEGQSPEATAGLAPGLVRKTLRILGRTAEYGSVADTTSESWPVEFGIGACQLFPRSAWSDVGGIDESFFYGPEDVDFCLRVLESGRSVRQVANAPVIHPPRRRNRNPLNRAGLKHAGAVALYLGRHGARLVDYRRKAS